MTEEYNLVLPASIQLQVSANGTPPFTYAWVLPDGSTSSLASPMFNFTTVGTFNVSVTVTDSTGLTGNETFQITVVSETQTPTNFSVVLNATPTSGNAPLLVAFSTTVNGGTSPYTYLLSFGDGNSTKYPTNNHKYQNKGTFNASVLVTDSKGETGKGTQVITVS